MATYTAITDAEIDQDSPITQTLMTKYRDNLTAVTEGASGAPRIVGSAAKYFDDYPVLTVSAADTYSVSFGLILETLTTTTTNSDNPPTVVAYRYTVELYSGSMRFKATHASSSSFEVSRLSLYKNGSLVQAYTTTSTSGTARSVDVSITSGDILEWRHSATGGASSGVSNVSVTADDGYTTRNLYLPFSEETTS